MLNKLLTNLWQDDSGFLISSELVLVSTLGVLGMTAGLAEVSQNVHNELHDTGTAFRGMNQSYSITTPNGTVCHFSDSHQAQ